MSTRFVILPLYGFLVISTPFYVVEVLCFTLFIRLLVLGSLFDALKWRDLMEDSVGGGSFEFSAFVSALSLCPPFKGETCRV